jgi:ubiquinone/menaquinone biosynthesis C-methylase UbiE
VKATGEVAPSASVVTSAYDAIAPVYDGHLRADQVMRRQLWNHYARLFRPGMRVLDVGCGTGTDAIFLARHGVQVEAVDVSPGMLAELERKVRAAGLAPMVRSRLLAVSELATLPPASFDGIISAYAALNTAPDLAAFSAAAARLLRPGGSLAVHMLNPRSTWDLLARVARRDPWQRLATTAGTASGDGERRNGRLVPIGGLAVYHTLWPADDFRLVRASGMGAFAPPAQRRLPPGLLAALGTLERCVGGWPCWRRWGRFFVLELAAR